MYLYIYYLYIYIIYIVIYIYLYIYIYIYIYTYNKWRFYSFCHKGLPFGDNWDNSKNFFCPKQLILLLQTDSRKFPNCPKLSYIKEKPLFIIKLVSKWKGAIRTGHTSLLVFRFWDLKLVTFDLALSSALGDLTFFFQECGCGTTKSSQTWKSRLKFYGNVLYY